MVRELRVAMTVRDFDRALALYRDRLGLDPVESWDEPTGRGAVLAAGRATLELIDEAQAGYIDSVEVGSRVAGPIRLAFQVDDDPDDVARELTAAGATVVAPAVVTPWGHRNARLADPDGTQLTLFALPGEEDPGDQDPSDEDRGGGSG
jgi:catechol 2,3-dioxygenase-like lactoylglutathione lyase family enzyme